jgi:hypothetical protein
MKESPEEQKENSTTGVSGSPKFGRLLIVLFLVVIGLGLLTWATDAYYS